MSYSHLSQPRLNHRTIEVTEYQPKRIPAHELPQELGEQLWRDHSNVIEVQFPSPHTDNQWQLRSLGVVGHIPLSPELSLRLRPKVPLTNVFGMLEYAYGLKSFRFLDGWSECDRLEDFYERLASILAQRILDRSRQGLYQTYLNQNERLPYLRGQLQLSAHIRRPWSTQLQCRYQAQTADIEDNQILLWTLRQIANAGLVRPTVAATVRRAYRALQGSISLVPYGSQSCLGRFYHRLNQDYQPLHAICHFFLEQTGPNVERGNRRMLPFLVNMNRLYEQFVAQWLKTHQQECLAPYGLRVKDQVSVILSAEHSLRFNIDLVLEEIATGKPRFVLDTKYKRPQSPSASDVAQIIAYAAVKGTTKGVLVYPQPLERAFNAQVQAMKICSATFPLSGCLEQAGQNFVQKLLAGGCPTGR